MGQAELALIKQIMPKEYNESGQMFLDPKRTRKWNGRGTQAVAPPPEKGWYEVHKIIFWLQDGPLCV